MSSAISIFDITLTNWGPLPATPFTPPASCSTISTVEIFATDLPDLIWQECNPQTSPLCYAPSPTAASAVDEYISINAVAGDGQIGAVYSPAPGCPDGYKTVGVASRDGEGSVTREGFLEKPVRPTRVDLPEDLIPSIFPSGSSVVRRGAQPVATPTPTPAGPKFDPADFPVVFGRDDALIAALEPAETAVWSMTAGLNGYCSSVLPSYTFSFACQAIFRTEDTATYTTGIPQDDGSTTEGALLLLTATTTGKLLTTGISDADASGFVAVSVVPPLTLVHKPTDLASGSGSVEEEDEAVFTGAAAKITLGGGSAWSDVVGVAGVLLASALAGGMLVLA
ncbi:hypothetical protein BJX62DRAFT_242739 [Aspergillus germanicus]